MGHADAGKITKKQYAKADITNSADTLIRKELDEANTALEQVIFGQFAVFISYLLQVSRNVFNGRCNLYQVYQMWCSYW